MMKDFIRNDRTQEPVPGNVDNVRFFILSIQASLRYNDWLERIEIKTSEHCSGSKIGPDFPVWRDWTYVDDSVVARLRTFASRTGCDFRPAKDFLWDALASLAMLNRVDPAVDLVAGLERAWDGTPRLSSWLSVSCGVPDDAYHRAVARNIVGGMVRRIREPGCKHDECALFVSSQGLSKSTLARTLAPNPEWFDDTISMATESKELVLALAGKCVVEFSEMAGSKRDVSHIKAMLSRTVDRGRTAYARSVTERKRRHIFVASTNEEKALVDVTGNRRFLPVRVEREIDLAWLTKSMPQIIGEAATEHSRGASFAIPRSVWGAAAEHQESARSQRPFEVYLDEWFGGDDKLHTFITAGDLQSCVASIDPRVGTGYATKMRALGFRTGSEFKKHIPGKGTVSVWCRGDLATATRLHAQGDGRVVRPILLPLSEPGKIGLPQVVTQ